MSSDLHHSIKPEVESPALPADDDHVLLCAMGDVMINRPDPPGFSFNRVQPWLDAADIVFGNCEGAYTTSTVRAPSCVVPCTSEPHNVASLGRAGIDVMSCANNHFVDAGHEGLLETLDLLHAEGILTTGAGRNIQEAREPAYLTRGGLTFAFLAYASVFPTGYDARATLPGIAPARALTHYAPPESKYYSPGEPAVVTTFPLEEDLTALRDDIARAKRHADVVIASFHWGLFSTPEIITRYERTYARAAIDAGCDAVLGHHHHTLRGIETYRGKPVFYGLGHFAFDVPDFGSMAHRDGIIADITQKRIADDGASAINPQDDYPYLPFGPDGRITMLAFIDFTAAGVSAASYLPCYILPSGEVEAVEPGTERGDEVIAFVRRACESQGMSADFTVVPSAAVNGTSEIRVL